MLLVLACQALARKKDRSYFPYSKCKEKSGAEPRVVQDFSFGMYFMSCTAVVAAIVFILFFKPRYLRLEAEQRYSAAKILGFGNNSRSRSPADGQESVTEVN